MTTPRRPKASDFDPEVLDLFDKYVHGLIDRRGFLTGAARFAVGATGAAALLAALTPQFAAAQQIKPDDQRLQAGFVEFDSPKGYGKGRGYLVRPAKAAGPLPLVLVSHENRGLNPHIEDVARRMALENFIAFAPDALFPLGGYPGDEDAARAKFATLDQDKTRQDFLAAARYLRSVEGSNGRMGAVGFCWGGGMSNFLASQCPDLDAAAPFYGNAAPLEDVGDINAELLVVLAANDERINKEWPAYEAALKAAGVKYTVYQPEGTQHGFHNDTTPRYDEDAAREAWRRTLTLFNRTLRGQGGKDTKTKDKSA
ncbi:dienelactone hydrolase family protein [Agrilutibacter solisilvae]|uniref:Dienelactone hydrolase family protein n=1 Tax=Agrilutibacter solisilvae TaxID=2763317 RepID=A0A974XY79_9GAMM|nr:dienelactone hydrolase family protein [Lysobacter solisilvae]QSX77818.1 dienelactone hydrolase family protein [Lysobacter solisilvae]